MLYLNEINIIEVSPNEVESNNVNLYDVNLIEMLYKIEMKHLLWYNVTIIKTYIGGLQ